MNKLWLAFVLFFVAIAQADDFEIVRDPQTLSFPKDHGSHPQYRTEWWYFTGHLSGHRQTDKLTRKFGFELTFFRVGLKQAPSQIIEESNWRTSNIFLAHFAISDDYNQTFHFSERKSRESFALAGADISNLKVWIRDWKAELNKDDINLIATAPQFSMDLNFKSSKPPILNGKNGYSKKGPGLEEASMYSSLTRLIGNGKIKIEEQEFKIDSAQAWMDHEAFTSKDPKGGKRWNWFAIQLDSNQEIMAYLLLDEAGVPTEFSSGTFVDKEGNYFPLKKEDFNIQEISKWKSPKTGIEYPSGWKLSIKDRGISLQIIPSFKDQEIKSEETTGVTYWEGRCLVSGSEAGSAYVELVGYD
jgi:predicted secreted hydrolase